jgi:hypothetical protein
MQGRFVDSTTDCTQPRTHTGVVNTFCSTMLPSTISVTRMKQQPFLSPQRYCDCYAFEKCSPKNTEAGRRRGAIIAPSETKTTV